jgi:hypothetical protein
MISKGRDYLVITHKVKNLLYGKKKKKTEECEEGDHLTCRVI